MIIRPDFFTHWKTKALITMLDDQLAPIYLQKLWLHCELSKKAEFEFLPTFAVASICDFEGDPEVLDQALQQTGWITRDGDAVVVEGWEEHNAALVQRWEAGARGGRPRKKSSASNRGKEESEAPANNRSETGAKPGHNRAETGAKPGTSSGCPPINRSETGAKPGHNRGGTENASRLTGAKPIDNRDDIDNRDNKDSNNPPNPPGGGNQGVLKEFPKNIDPDLWRTYLTALEETKKPLPPASQEMLLHRLEAYGARANEMLERAIVNGWRRVILDTDRPPPAAQRHAPPPALPNPNDAIPDAAKADWQVIATAVKDSEVLEVGHLSEPGFSALGALSIARVEQALKEGDYLAEAIVEAEFYERHRAFSSEAT